eukprot:TRINITY_DN9899_c0_g2_i1.p1 TRINITY_DN9899_c0_g2~~TRINITY_DN9899_c0_g2_i1.p1  ORF type:complete len:212 (-),score=49.51 TRINITY_DN9899_c0_g2_i1:6-641(-)
MKRSVGTEGIDAIGGKPCLTSLKEANEVLLGQAGVIRCFFRVHDIEFEEYSISLEDEELLLQSGKLPAAKTLPVVRIGEFSFAEFVSTLRYLSRKIGIYGEHPFQDFSEDAVAAEAEKFRSSWVQSLCSTDSKETYKRVKRHEHLSILEAYYSMPVESHPHLNNRDFPGFSDLTVLGILHDDINTDPNKEETHLDLYPHLKSLYNSLRSIL